jgi:hypothetical protein
MMYPGVVRLAWLLAVATTGLALGGCVLFFGEAGAGGGGAGGSTQDAAMSATGTGGGGGGAQACLPGLVVSGQEWVASIPDTEIHDLTPDAQGGFYFAGLLRDGAEATLGAGTWSSGPHLFVAHVAADGCDLVVHDLGVPAAEPQITLSHGNPDLAVLVAWTSVDSISPPNLLCVDEADRTSGPTQCGALVSCRAQTDLRNPAVVAADPPFATFNIEQNASMIECDTTSTSSPLAGLYAVDFDGTMVSLGQGLSSARMSFDGSSNALMAGRCVAGMPSCSTGTGIKLFLASTTAEQIESSLQLTADGDSHQQDDRAIPFPGGAAFGRDTMNDRSLKIVDAVGQDLAELTFAGGTVAHFTSAEWHSRNIFVSGFANATPSSPDVEGVGCPGKMQSCSASPYAFVAEVLPMMGATGRSLYLRDLDRACAQIEPRGGFLDDGFFVAGGIYQCANLNVGIPIQAKVPEGSVATFLTRQAWGL